MTANTLIIGAMKSGTTSLWRDLKATRGVRVTRDKEPDILSSNGSLAQMTDAYREYFRDPAEGVLVDASTSYTKWPTYQDVPEKALAVCGPKLRLVYLLRNPVDRLVSQYRHEFEQQKTTTTLSQAILKEERFVAYSRYAQQLQLWLRHFRPEQVALLRFEDYIAASSDVRAELGIFLGLDWPVAASGSKQTNASAYRPSNGTFSYRLCRTSSYRRFVRPLLPGGSRSKLRNISAVLSRDVVSAPPLRASAEALAYLHDVLVADAEQLSELLPSFEGRWDLESSLSALQQ